MSPIPVKETYFNGIKFRSRIEARWACLFDAIGISYQYEPEKFNLPNGTVYIPDFYLVNMHPGPGVYFEVKGPEPSAEESESCKLLAEVTDGEVFLFHGSNFNTGMQLSSYGDDGPTPVGLKQCPFCGCFGFEYNRWPESQHEIEIFGYPRFPYHECLPMDQYAERMDIADYFLDWMDKPTFPWNVTSPVLSLAINLAKSYRFESPEFQHEASGIRQSIRTLMDARVFSSPVVMEAITAYVSYARHVHDCPRYERPRPVAK